MTAAPAALGEPCALEVNGLNGSACFDTNARCAGGVCIVDDPTTCG